jgi:hypothetical protein
MSWGSFYSTRDVKSARKSHRCDECMREISVGSPYRKWSCVAEGEFWHGTVHQNCQDWANHVIALNDDNARPFLCDADPEEDFDGDLKAHPCPPEVWDRLPQTWKSFLAGPGRVGDG